MSPITARRHRKSFTLAALVLAAGLPLAASAQTPEPGKTVTLQPVPPPPPSAIQTPDELQAKFPLKFEHTSFDWGDIADTDKVNHIFKFTNGSEETVSISGLVGSCGCTGGTLTKNDYAPNEAGEITATFDPTNRVGPQPKTLTVNLKDGRSFILHLSSNVKPFVYLDQQKMQFMEIMKGTETTQGFTVIGRSPEFKITSLDVSDPNAFTAVAEDPQIVEENGEKLQKVHIKVTLKATQVQGPHSAQITVHTNDAHKPTLQAMANAQVVGELRTAPPMLFLRQNQPSVAFEQEVQLDNRMNKPFEITAIDVEGPGEMQLVADFGTNPNGPGYIVKLTGVTPPIPGQFRGNVIVKTNIADEDEVKIQFFANVVNVNGAIPNANSGATPTSRAPINPGVTVAPTAPPKVAPPSGH